MLDISNGLAGYRQLVAAVAGGGREPQPVTLPEAAQPYLIAALYRSLKRPLLVVCAQPERAEGLREQLGFWDEKTVPSLFPEPDALPYQRLATSDTAETEKLALLAALSDPAPTHPPLIITSIPALTAVTIDRDRFTSAGHTLKVGQEIEPRRLRERWQALGYRHENTVEVPGAVSHRGGILDIYPPATAYPARLEFFGNTIESIRLFDPVTQLSREEVTGLTVTPATELLTPLGGNDDLTRQIIEHLDLRSCNLETRTQFSADFDRLLERQLPAERQFYSPLFNRDCLLSYLPPASLVIIIELHRVQAAAEDLDTKARELRADKEARGELPPNFPTPYFSSEELAARLSAHRCLNLSSLALGTGEAGQRLDFAPQTVYGGQLPAFIEQATRQLRRRHRIIAVSQQAERLAELLTESGIIAAPQREITAPPPPGSLSLIQGSLDRGWTMDGTVHLFTDYEIFGLTKQRRAPRKHPAPHRDFLSQLKPGDYVVHIEHGIARFSGMTTLTGDHQQKEYLILEYAAADRLYVPADQISRVSRYIGSGDSPPTLSRLGTPEWQRTKEKTRQAVEIIADELLNLYATRGAADGFAFSPDTVWQQELEASFPYIETPDQMTIQQAVKEDMMRPRPMDRLICGDVGYGKTEIAIRAAFKAVMDQKQAAVLVPTTVLAQQHFITFSERLKAFPVNIAVLSRFKTPREQDAILEGLARGTVDICIGTHRLLQKDVVFKDLGLLVIDEEQRFGVSHKESLKQKRQEIDVLTLSATPIPRTLHMSLVGVRDMSVMETPPEDRLPIRTYVAEYDDSLVREAILREMERNGQVFFVHNRVQTIPMMTAKIKALVPEARVGMAHGQMAEDRLEAVMSDFTGGEIDVLVCTTIIESGLDLPNVNTLIINRADRLGLTQLYQLRGRVGRGSSLAYAYFLYGRNQRLSAPAEKRLGVIFEATELGAGLNIALKDLEIRGAGTLLGTRQSGHINAVGFNLYCRLLAEAIAERQAEGGTKGKPRQRPSQLPPTSVELPLAISIPEDYIGDDATRLALYIRLANITDPADSDRLAEEMRDRFGPLPPAAGDLLYTVRLRALATATGIETISAEDGDIVVRLFRGMQLPGDSLRTLPRKGLKIGHNQLRLAYRQLPDWRARLEAILTAIAAHPVD